MAKLKNSKFIPKLYAAFEDGDSNYMVMQLMKGSIYSIKRKYKELSMYQIQFIAASIITGLEDIHNIKVLHKDIKPDNVLIDENGYLFITDFGISKPWASA